MSKQLVILAPKSDADAAANGMPPLGSRAEVMQRLAQFNTAPEQPGEDEILYGPGIRVQLPPADPVTQMLLTINEDDIAWLVIMRMIKSFGWQLLDPETGRTLGS